MHHAFEHGIMHGARRRRAAAAAPGALSSKIINEGLLHTCYCILIVFVGKSTCESPLHYMYMYGIISNIRVICY